MNKKRSKLFMALSHEVRLKILDMCMDAEVPLPHIQKKLRMEPSHVGHHCRLLKDAGLIVSRREGKTAMYRVPGKAKSGDALCIGKVKVVL